MLEIQTSKILSQHTKIKTKRALTRAHASAKAQQSPLSLLYKHPVQRTSNAKYDSLPPNRNTDLTDVTWIDNRHPHPILTVTVNRVVFAGVTG